MLHITVGAKKKIDPKKDGLGRQYIGYDQDMNPETTYDHIHGEWAIGARSMKEKYVLFSFNRIVIQALEIERIKITTPRNNAPGEHRDDKCTIYGEVIKDGNSVFEKYVGKETPVTPGRNPVRYFVDPELDAPPGRSCRCGCGETTLGGDFIPGHDQKAIHERIARIGTVSEFLDFMDAVRPSPSRS